MEALDLKTIYENRKIFMAFANTPEQVEELETILKMYENGQYTTRMSFGDWLGKAWEEIKEGTKNTVTFAANTAKDLLTKETITTEKTGTDAKTQRDNTIMYVGIALGSLVVIGLIVYFVFRKK